MIVEIREVHACDRCGKITDIVPVDGDKELCQECADKYEKMMAAFWEEEH